MKKSLQKTRKIGSLAINQTLILVLGIIVLVVIAAFFVFLGDQAGEIVRGILHFPGGIIEAE